ncbi:MAG: excinuclease ABC subunit UvrC [Pseudomonadota bacterium]
MSDQYQGQHQDQAQHSISMDRGASVIADYVKQLPATPGVYRMLNAVGDVLYIGKAKALKKRVSSYTQVKKLPNRLKRMVAETVTMEFVHTHTEVEALLLESNLIKKLKPRFNILLRDDKSFPYIFISSEHDFPRLEKHRGAKARKGEYFGPFASAGAVNRTINTLQKVFLLRTCSDREVEAGDRPCLNYHMKRCAGPCGNKISKEEYAELVRGARQFLKGESRVVQDTFVKMMEQASKSEDFEKAAELRDRIKAMAAIQATQDINIEGLGDVDLLALTQKNGQSCIQVFFYRGGQNFGNRAYFPRHHKDEEKETILSVFLAQFYENKPIPRTILVNIIPDEKALLEEAFSLRKNSSKVKIMTPQRGQRRRLIDFVLKNAAGSLDRHLALKASEKKHMEEAAKLFDMNQPPRRIEVYDNSHISGTNQVGGMIVATEEGFQKNAYRKFNIKTADKSDDYGMMREVMERRFSRALRENVSFDSEDWPDLLLIDGGKGQLSSVMEVLEELGIDDRLTVVGIAKGPDRNAGREQFFMAGRDPFMLPVNDPTLHYLQRLRDEVHRFAIGAHRKRRQTDIAKSLLDEVPGIGAKRKKALLRHFGSAKDVAGASIQDLRAVSGVSEAIAEKIYNHFNEG